MCPIRVVLTVLGTIALIPLLAAQIEIGALRITPNLAASIDHPLRYRPDGEDFVVEHGAEFFNRPLYGGNTSFRVDGGDRPEFVLYLPGRGGNLRFGIRAGEGVKWLHDAARIVTRYRPGSLHYEIGDPLLGANGTLKLAVIAYAQTEGVAVRVESTAVTPGVEFVWAYGGVNGARGRRDGDIGTESVPISQWFQLRPEFCRGNVVGLTKPQFTIRALPATIVGIGPAKAQLAVGDATLWNDPAALVAGAFAPAAAQARGATSQDVVKPALPVVVGRVLLTAGETLHLSLQRVADDASEPPDLDTYREVTAKQPNDGVTVRRLLAPPYALAELPARFAEAERHFAALRRRVIVDTPDPFINAAVGSLNVAADAVWDEPQQAIMHGAIAWRTKLLGWRGPYALDALGWHDRARSNFSYWIGRQNMGPIPAGVPPADERANFARNEAGLHTNGDFSNSHYDMNLVFVDALFRHLEWTGDLAFAKEVWPAIQRHLAWERRLFRREFGPEKLPLYEAYAAIWASDDLQYSGGGAAHTSAYNYYHNRQAARLARLIGEDPAPYDREADLIARGMRELLWVTAASADAAPATIGEPARRDESAGAGRGVKPLPQLHESAGGWFAECKDWLGGQRVHPSAAVWTFYHTVDSEVPTPMEAWQMAGYVNREIPHLPVRGPGVPEGLCTIATSNWMPYDWSINNVVMAEALHTALALWRAGRADDAWTITKGSLLAAMYMGISPGNVGSMSYLDVYRRESQRDFADGSGVMSRAIVEGLFGVKPDALAGELHVAPGWPAAWDHTAIRHPDFSLSFERHGDTDTYVVGQVMEGGGSPGFPRPLAVRLRVAAQRDHVGAVTVNGEPAEWRVLDDSVGMPRIEVAVPAGERGSSPDAAGGSTRPAAAAGVDGSGRKASPAVHTIVIRWAGSEIAQPAPSTATADPFVRVEQGQMRWWRSPEAPAVRRGAGSGDDRPGEGSPMAARNAGDAAPVANVDLRGATFEPVDLTSVFNDSVTQIFKNQYRSPRSPFVSLALPKQGIGGWAGGVNRTAVIDDSGLRAEAARQGGRIMLPDGVPFTTAVDATARNVVFTSQWDNYPREAKVVLTGRARGVFLLMAGSTNPMQSRFENGEVVIAYADGSTSRLPLINPTNWWPIEQDYFIDDFQFRRPEPLPIRVDLKTGRIRVLQLPEFKGCGRAVDGGAATVLSLPLDPARELKALTVRATANDVVIGLMAATLVR